ncbi:MAG: rane protein [Paenibacillus sp.]|nr:rane protein [Paenibacillus sp.]
MLSMDISTLFLRTVLIYFVVFITLRIMGKREIGKLSVFDLVISIMIAEIAVFVIEDTSLPLIHGLLPMLTLVLIQILIAYLSLKSQTVRGWFDGQPSFVIQNGKLNREEMSKQRYSLDDLLLQLRENKVNNVADVEFAILETSGKLSVVEKPKDQRSIPSAQGEVKFSYEGLPVSLIMDGKVQNENLEKLGKTRFWLKNQLQAKGIMDFKEVFYCSVDHKGKLYTDLKRKR